MYIILQIKSVVLRETCWGVEGPSCFVEKWVQQRRGFMCEKKGRESRLYIGLFWKVLMF